MISKKTVLVLGAGSGIPFGFPSGVKLMEMVCDIPKHPDTYKEFYSYLHYKDIDDESIARFFRDLKYSGRQSVDAFLEHQSDFYNMTGKVAIAAILIPYENKDKLFEQSGNWLGILFNQMSGSFGEYSNNQLSIITYNYDRSVECFLYESLLNSYQHSRQEVAKALNSIPIIHLHGDLGKPHHLTYLGEQNSNCRGYKGSLTMPDLELASSRIKIIHENIDNDPEFTDAKKLLEDADIIAFLGFGYNDVNIQRLGVSRIPFLQFNEGKAVSIYGTAYGLGRAESEWVESVIPRIKLGGASEEIKDILLNEPILIQPVSTKDLFYSKLGKTT